METMKKNYDIIDIVKFIASLCVFLMHSNIFYSLSGDLQFYGVELIARWGVPFFFTISAYFLFSRATNGNITKEQLLNYIKRLALLYIAWFILNIPSIAYNLYIRGISNPETWLNFLLNAVISSTFTGSWYLTSSMFSAFLVYLLSKKLSTRYVFIITLILYIFCVVTSTYDRVLSLNLGFTTCTTIISGAIFYALGKIIAENRDNLLKMNKWILLLLVLSLFSVYYLEMTILKVCNVLHTTDTSIILIPFVFFFVLFLLKVNLKIKGSVSFRKASTIIYCSHGTAILISNIIARKFILITHSCFQFLLSSITCAIIVLIILFLDRKNKIKTIKYLT